MVFVSINKPLQKSYPTKLLMIIVNLILRMLRLCLRHSFFASLLFNDVYNFNF
ncbi:hypothetical protein ECH_0880 [Ehrlichia chaffeensis str. Arkansas]|uniref:Uncharacterized protein n=1 Tax=Ehrlichia chaffeensis (strain ATCC CRL-10679 / Arkansas) TaxID=205920 RepID=Q2GFV8_EHRCR|nr:hypothetical protein ECH_0880 [Ehrlichia chaffeensis str. Arkansas]AHX05348.1 hypothetical protein ECHJAX_0271 [Ehrlichia chaffeensis str. Jax]AHX09606.1 hypothetical protein ECHWAK_0268 [Ehrlichia chaffeensis str. Wakulla]